MWFGDPVADYDEQVYSHIGRGLLEGHLPYVETWDRKPFGLFALYALAHLLGGPGPLAYQLLASGLVLLGAWQIRKLILPITGQVGGIMLALLYPVGMSVWGNHSGQSEAIFMPFLLGAFIIVLGERDRARPARLALAMLLCGLALQIKYTVLPACLFLGLQSLWYLRLNGAGPIRLLRLAVVFVAIGLLPTLLVGLAYAATGAFQTFWFANFVSIFERDGLSRWYGMIERATLILLAPAACGLITASQQKDILRNPRYLALLGFGSSLMIGVFLPAMVLRYYLAMAVAGTLLVAAPLVSQGSRWLILPYSLIWWLWIFMTFPIENFQMTRENRGSFVDLVSVIAPQVDQERQCLWIHDGPVALYRASGSCVPTRWAYPDHLNNWREHNALEVEQVAEVQRILATRPPVIVTADFPVTEPNEQVARLVEDELAAHYRRLATRRILQRDITVWQRPD
ncbi:ArnT family glycosyltransferase [Qipengyuania soli]|uniref:Glycosyltransferase RgtA/B/C/D-like domain-containing protein n=1 Tax=Qipengyuania soli TaxID=2782568 RepID=A0A7S8ITL7_9SPHN|nr:hypothetical protein [Qipengyuania soli]QPC97954.1 hypothetical protein IRL76_08595 [Qipengyuania soli]